MRRVLAFAPFSGIWPHGLSEAQMLDQLDRANFAVTVARCRGVLGDHCVVMESMRLDLSAPPGTKAEACRNCRRCTDSLARSFPFPTLDLDVYVEPSDFTDADILIGSATPSNYLDLRTSGIDIGRLCSYETLIKFKKTTTELNAAEFEYYLTTLREAFLSLRASERILSLGKFDAVMIYSPQYAANIMCAEAAMARGVAVYFVEGSSNIHERYKALRVWSWPHFRMVNPALTYYQPGKDMLGASDIQRVKSHFREIEMGRSYSVYSPTTSRQTDIRSLHGIPHGRRIILAALSSYDEAYSALVIGGFPKEKFESDVFATQFDWIEALVEWVAARDDLHLVVRLHPRDLPNRRDSIVSEQFSRWAHVLTNLPGNVCVDHPDQKIPIADYFGQIAVLTTGWSSTAVEALMERVPVVTYDSNLPSYPRAIHYSGRTRSEYWLNLDKAVLAEHGIAISASAMDWMVFNFNKGTIRVRGRLFDHELVQRHRVLYYLVGGIAKYLPRLSRRLDIGLWRIRPASSDSSRLNHMMYERAPSLYDL